jgi:hypothetical protein
MTQQEGLFSIPTRLLLTPEHRAKLEALVYAREVDLADFVSDIVATYLDAQTDVQPIAAPVPNIAAELRKRRAELARLRTRRDAAGGAAPTWLLTYIIALEAEVERLEQTLEG